MRNQTSSLISYLSFFSHIDRERDRAEEGTQTDHRRKFPRVPRAAQ